jgi:hypothetical protein
MNANSTLYMNAVFWLVDKRGIFDQFLGKFASSLNWYFLQITLTNRVYLYNKVIYQ